MGALLQLTGDVVRPAPGTRILKAEETSRLLEAEAILQAAHERAEAIKAEAEKIYEQRKEEGYEDGKEECKLNHAEKIMKTVLSSIEFIEGIESTLVDVVNQAIRKIIGDLGDDERIVRLVRTALNTVRTHQNVIIRIAPADEKAVSTALEPMLQNRPDASGYLRLVADARLERGSCLLESEMGVVDASLETQLKALERAFQAKIHT